MTDNYLNEFQKTCETTNEMILKKWPASASTGALAWAVANAPDLNKKEEMLYKRINTEWINAMDFDTFSKTVLEWGRALLKIYKRYFETMVEEGR